MDRPAKNAIPAAARRSVALAAGCRPGRTTEAACVYCGAKGKISWFSLASGRPGAWVHFAGLEIDHVVAESKGGPTAASNLVLSCRRCNRIKGAK